MPVTDLHREGERHLVVVAQEVEGAVRDIVVPDDRAGAIRLRMRRRIDREGIEQRILLRRRQRIAVRQCGGGDLPRGDRARLDVGQVDVGEVDIAGLMVGRDILTYCVVGNLRSPIRIARPR